jgi:hypothetical protein
MSIWFQVILSSESLGNKVAGAQKAKHTTGGIPRWPPTLVLVARFSTCVWQSGRDAQFSLTYGRMYKVGSTWLYVPYRLVRFLCL